MSRASETSAHLARIVTMMQEQVGSYRRRKTQVPNYLLGFLNGLVSAKHWLDGAAGAPELMEAAPERLRVEAIETPADEQEYELHIDKVLQAARATLWQQGEELIAGVSNLGKEIRSLDNFIEWQLAITSKAGQGEIASPSDAVASGQEGSSPSPAANEAGFGIIDFMTVVAMTSAAVAALLGMLLIHSIATNFVR